VHTSAASTSQQSLFGAWVRPLGVLAAKAAANSATLALATSAALASAAEAAVARSAAALAFTAYKAAAAAVESA